METARPLISESYRALQQDLHKNPNYGVASLGFAPIVRRLIEGLGVRSLCDYGAGKQNLRRALEAEGVSVEYHPYDPAFPEYGEARSGDLVCCIDVLEHIEPELLDNVLDDLQRLTVSNGFFTVHTGPAVKVLADGRNAHLIQEPQSWWLERLTARFDVIEQTEAPRGFMVLVQGRKA